MNEQEGERLQKVLARVGVGSRRAVEEMISAGRISVNGRRATLGQRVEPHKDVVEVDGAQIPLRADLVYYLVNKPTGVVSTASDPEGRPTVVDLVDAPSRIWPVGRLDVDSEGALILTNDGELTLRLTHPRYGVPKKYVVEMEGVVGKKALRRLKTGVELDDGITAPARAVILEKRPSSTLVEMTLHEGRNRQVRRMGDAVGHPVRRLVRVSVGPIVLGRLRPGSFRRLGAPEVQGLYRAVADNK